MFRLQKIIDLLRPIKYPLWSTIVSPSLISLLENSVSIFPFFLFPEMVTLCTQPEGPLNRIFITGMQFFPRQTVPVVSVNNRQLLLKDDSF